MTRTELVPAVKLIADGIRVLRTRDGKPITDEECLERANNIVEGLRWAYFMVLRPEVEVGLGAPLGHLAVCECSDCEAFRKAAS